MRAIDHLILKVNDLAKSVAFYRDVLGFEEAGVEGPFTLLRVSPTFQLQLAPYGTPGFEHYAFALSRAEFDEVLGRLRARGIPFGPRFDAVGKEDGIGSEVGARGEAPTAYFNDPNNHLLEVRTYDP
ncbi:MAG TPA: VOC family protein [Polyangiaceae bacterium]|jgi:catechol 2,3-dioxygenase-like lactoylglutathione lyase family enzyme|nr:VOC family protein [Polyangiaceae bacterium]